jgi:hypothetical protein
MVLNATLQLVQSSNFELHQISVVVFSEPFERVTIWREFLSS